MKVTMQEKSLAMVSLFGFLIIASVVSLTPNAFAQQSNNVLGLTPQDDPHGPLQPIAWGVGLAVAGLMTGVGVFTAVRRKGPR